MVRKDLLGKRFLLNDVIDYDNFTTAGEMYNLRWLDGHIMDSEVTDIFRKNTFPFVLEVDENGYVSFDRNLGKSITFKHFARLDPKNIEAPLTLLVNQKDPGITVTLPDGREFIYDIDNALKKPTNFNSWLKDITRPPIKVNDFVELVDVGQLYSTYFTWFKENNVDVDIAARYAYAREGNPSTCGHYRVLAIGKHNDDDDVTMYAITKGEGYVNGAGPVYLVNNRGIKKVQ